MDEKDRLQVEIDELNDQIKDLERKSEGARSQYLLAALGLILGLVLLFVLPWLGVLLTLAGILAAITQGIKRRNANAEIEELRAKVKDKRQQILS